MKSKSKLQKAIEEIREVSKQKYRKNAQRFELQKIEAWALIDNKKKETVETFIDEGEAKAELQKMENYTPADTPKKRYEKHMKDAGNKDPLPWKMLVPSEKREYYKKNQI